MIFKEGNSFVEVSKNGKIEITAIEHGGEYDEHTSLARMSLNPIFKTYWEILLESQKQYIGRINNAKYQEDSRYAKVIDEVKEIKKRIQNIINLFDKKD